MSFAERKKLRAGSGDSPGHRQERKYATKYSNVFDLKSGDIYLVDPSKPNEMRINLAAELEKGGHDYELPQLERELAEAPRPLFNEMKRFFLDEFSAVEDHESDVTSKVRAALQDTLDGTLQAAHYTPELWSQLSPMQEALQFDLKSFGNLDSIVLAARRAENDRSVYHYKIEFTGATALQSFTLDSARRIASIHSDGVEWKSPHPRK